MIVGTDGPGVIISARAAAWLERRGELSRLRVKVRGTDPEISRTLEEIRLVALQWGCSLPARTEEAPKPEQPARSEWLTTGTAADLMGIGPRGIQQAIARGLLPATKVGNRYQIRRDDLEHYRAARAA